MYVIRKIYMHHQETFAYRVGFPLYKNPKNLSYIYPSYGFFQWYFRGVDVCYSVKLSHDLTLSTLPSKDNFRLLLYNFSITLAR